MKDSLPKQVDLIALEEPTFTVPSSNQQGSTVQPPSPTVPPAPQRPPLVTSARGLGALTADLLKPKLKQWVDQKLEGVVERLIREEIKRIAGSN